MKKLILPAVLVLSSFHASAQGTAFTYGGRLMEAGQPANGIYDFTFQVFDAASGGGSFGGTVASNGVPVNNGLFLVMLDFGGSAFTGAERWLQISVSTNLAGNFSLLNPRQQFTPTPYAMFAGTSATVTNGAIGSAQLANSAVGGSQIQTGAITAPLIASAQVVKSLNGLADNVTLTPGANITINTLGNSLQLSAPNTGGWGLTGNGGTSPTNGGFIGTTDNQPLEIKVSGVRAARIEPGGDSSEDPDTTVDGAPNVILGAPVNFVSSGAVGATIAGGGATLYNTSTRINSILSSYGAIGGGMNNRIAPGANRSVIAGGNNIDIGTNSSFSAVGGGDNNNVAADSPYGAIAGGINNDLGTNSPYSAIGGGNNNDIAASSPSSVIAGGDANDIGINSTNSAIGGGRINFVTDSPYSTIAGGGLNLIFNNADYSAIGGGGANGIFTNATAATIGGGRNNIIFQNSPFSTIGGGTNNHIAADSRYSTVAGGFDNAAGYGSTVGGGYHNVASGGAATVGGGTENTASEFTSTVSGGGYNNASGQYATVPGGADNSAQGNFSFAAGYHAKADHAGSFVWADSRNQEMHSQGADSVTFRCAGGVLFWGGTPEPNVTFVSWQPGNTSWFFASDRNLKEGFKSLDTQAVLEKVVRLPMTEWNYRGYPQRHIGPMAQDFHAQFPLNTNDTMIDSGDLHGVALAAIQGLNQKFDQKLEQKETEITELKRTVNELKELVQAMNYKLNGSAK